MKDFSLASEKGERMFIRWLVLFFSTMTVGLAAGWVFYSVVMNAENRILFGYQFSSLLSFSFAGALVYVMCLYFPNVLTYYVSGIAYHQWFNQRSWAVTLTFTASIFAASFVVIWLKVGQLPNKSELIGLMLSIVGALVSAFWHSEG